MKRLLLISLFSIWCLGTLMAQEKPPIVWPEEGKYRVDTIYNKPYPYNLFVNAFGQFEGDLFGSAAGLGIGLYGRYTIAKRIIVSGTIIGMPKSLLPNEDIKSNYDYHIFEARAAIPFRRSKEPVAVSKKLYSYYYYEGSQKYQRTYTANFNVMGSTYTGLTGSVSQSHRYYGQQKDSAGRSFALYDKNDANKTRVYKRAQIGYSTFMWSVGLYYSSGMKFKGKAYATLEGLHKRKTVRVKTIIDMSAELLVGKTIADKNIIGVYDNGSWKYDSALVNKYEIMSFDGKKTGNDAVQMRNLGWRIQLNMKKGWWGFRTEMGVKPGIDFDYSQNGAKAENDWLVKRLNRAYLMMGIGFGIGAL